MDTYVNQVLRATVDNEYLTGPGAARFGFQQDSGLVLLYMRRWPVTEVLAIQVSPNRAFPRTWSTVPAGQYEVNHPLIDMFTDTASATVPDGGSSIVVNPYCFFPGAGRGWVRAAPARNSVRALVSYTNGWPHSSLTQSASATDSTIDVDDVTGWAGASGFIYDGSSTEPLAVTDVAATVPVNLPNGVGAAQSGPGTLTLSSPLMYGHDPGIVVSSLPANVMQATILAAAAQALESGIESIAIQAVPGTQTSSGQGVADLVAQYKKLLDPYARVI